MFFFFFSSRRRHTRSKRDWSSDVCSSDLGGLVAAAFGIAFGLPSIRTRGEYLAIVTLAFGEIVPGVIWHVPYWTGGSNGLSGVPLPTIGLSPGGDSRAAQAYTLALLLAV